MPSAAVYLLVSSVASGKKAKNSVPDIFTADEIQIPLFLAGAEGYFFYIIIIITITSNTEN